MNKCSECKGIGAVGYGGSEYERCRLCGGSGVSGEYDSIDAAEKEVAQWPEWKRNLSGLKSNYSQELQ